MNVDPLPSGEAYHILAYVVLSVGQSHVSLARPEKGWSLYWEGVDLYFNCMVTITDG